MSVVESGSQCLSLSHLEEHMNLGALQNPQGKGYILVHLILRGL